MSAIFCDSIWIGHLFINEVKEIPSDDTLTIIDSLENISEMNDLDRVFQIEGIVYIKILGHIIMLREQTSFSGRYNLVTKV